MARNSRNESTNSKVKIRYMEVEAEGSSETIQDAWRSLQQAFARPKQAIPTRLIAAGTGRLVAEEVTAGEDAIVEIDADPGEASSEMEAEAESRSPKAKSTPRKEPAWEILEIDAGTGTNSLEEFMKQAPTKVIMRRFLLFAYWLKVHRNIDAIKPPHIVTCYRLLGWPVPKSIIPPLADMKRKKQWIDKAGGEYEYTINLAGISEVERMLSAE